MQLPDGPQIAWIRVLQYTNGYVKEQTLLSPINYLLACHFCMVVSNACV